MPPIIARAGGHRSRIARNVGLPYENVESGSYGGRSMPLLTQQNPVAPGQWI